MEDVGIDSLVSVNGNKLRVKHIKRFVGRPTIVFLHDSLGCIELWRDWPFVLADETGCNVLVYDRQGYGKSEPMSTFDRPSHYLEIEADVLHDLLAQLGIKDTIIFGHSDGGSIALIYASKYPEYVKAAISEAGHIFVEEITLKGIEATLGTYYNDNNLGTRLKKYHGDKVETLFKAWTLTWTGSEYRHWNIEHFLPGISCPLLVIQGEADEYGTLLQVKRTIEQVSGQAEEFIIPGVGHTPHKEAAEIVSKRVKEFIEATVL